MRRKTISQCVCFLPSFSVPSWPDVWRREGGFVPRLYPGIAVVAVVYAAFFGKALLSPPAPNPFVNLAGWLSKKNLDYGYGTYWASSITTVSSENRVKVRAVIPVGEQLGPKWWIMDRNWYRDTPAHFLVFWTSHDDDPDFTMKLQTATRTLGHPQRSPGWESIRC